MVEMENPLLNYVKIVSDFGNVFYYFFQFRIITASIALLENAVFGIASITHRPLVEFGTQMEFVFLDLY